MTRSLMRSSGRIRVWTIQDFVSCKVPGLGTLGAVVSGGAGGDISKMGAGGPFETASGIPLNITDASRVGQQAGQDTKTGLEKAAQSVDQLNKADTQNLTTTATHVSDF